MHPYERWMIRRYLANALKSKRYLTAPEPRADLLIWIKDQGRALKLPTLEQPPVALRYCMDDKTERRFKANWRIWRTSVLALPQAPQPPVSPLQKRIDWVAEACTLNASQKWALGLFARIARAPTVAGLAAAINEQLSYQTSNLTFSASELENFHDAIFEARDLSDQGLLLRLGLLDNRRNELRLSDVVGQMLSQKRMTPSRIRNLLLGGPLPASLAWDDFEPPRVCRRRFCLSHAAIAGSSSCA